MNPIKKTIIKATIKKYQKVFEKRHKAIQNQKQYAKDLINIIKQLRDLFDIEHDDGTTMTETDLKNMKVSELKEIADEGMKKLQKIL